MTETAVTADLWLKLHGSAETELRRNLRAYFVALGKHLAKPIRAAAEKPESAGAAKLVSAKEIRTGLTAVVRPFATKQMTAGARDLWQQYLTWKTSRKRPKPSDFTLPREVVKAIEHKAERLLGEPYWLDVAETVRSDLVTALARGVLNGLSGSDLAGEVLAVLGPVASNARAQRIARTESTSFLNGGHQASRDVLEADGVLEKKEWMSISDQDTRPAHEQANGQQVANAKMFTIGGEQCMYPGDTRLSAENRCNCRCTSTAVFE